MANTVYDKAKEQFLQGGINLLTDDIRVILIDRADYTFDVSHEFLSSVPAAARVATSGALTGKTVTDGVFDAADPVFTAVTGDVSEDLLYYKHTGADGTARLIYYQDTNITNSPVTPNGGNINLTHAATGIFKL